MNKRKAGIKVSLLWYRQPAKNWMTEALPIGNGRIGAMFLGGVERERIQFNEESLWTGRPFIGAEGTDPERYTEVHNYIKAGKFAEANESGADLRATCYGTPAYTKYQEAFGAYQAFGDLYLDVKHPEGALADYRRQLDIVDAVGGVSYSVGDVTYRREYLCSFPDQVMAVRMTASQPGQINVRAMLTTLHKNASTQARGDRLVLVGNLVDSAMAFEAQLAVRTKGGKATTTDDAIEIVGADEAELLFGAATDYMNAAFSLHTGEAPSLICRRHVMAAMEKPFDELRAAHVADYRDLYGRCTLELGVDDLAKLPTDERLARFRKEPDPALEALVFQYGRYLLISSSRPGTMPANLQGLWNDSTNPPWNCDWHLDINAQMNYWPTEATGLPECHAPLFGLIQTLQEPGREMAKRVFGARGWFAAINTNPWGYADNRWLCRSIAGWLCLHVWEHYLYTGDRDFLQRTGYPLMRDGALFLLDSLIETDGQLVVGLSESAENYYNAPDDGKRYRLNYGVAMDQQVAWDLFGNCVEAAKILGVEETLAKEFADARARLAPPRVGRFGQLQEWHQDLDDPEDHHRHTSHLWAVFPGRQITPQDTPALAKAAAVSLGHRGTAANGWAFPWRSLIYSRLRDRELAYFWLKGGMGYTTETNLIYDSGGGMYPNLFGASPPFQIDSNFGLTTAVAEMLLQSHRDEIELLPVLPKEWPDGKAIGLRARGGFVADIEWRDGKLVHARIYSSAGRTCRVRYGESAIELVIAKGDSKAIHAETFGAGSSGRMHSAAK